jgi:hypothetical protein
MVDLINSSLNNITYGLYEPTRNDAFHSRASGESSRSSLNGGKHHIKHRGQSSHQLLSAQDLRSAATHKKE